MHSWGGSAALPSSHITLQAEGGAQLHALMRLSRVGASVKAGLLPGQLSMVRDPACRTRDSGSTHRCAGEGALLMALMCVQGQEEEGWGLIPPSLLGNPCCAAYPGPAHPPGVLV